jgi:hypothetical protein
MAQFPDQIDRRINANETAGGVERSRRTDSDGISTIGIFWLKMNEWQWCWQAIKY